MIQHSPECVKVHLTGGIRSSRHIGADNHPIIARALELWLNRFPDLSDYLLTLEMDRWNHETVSWFQPGVSPQTYISQMIGGMADLHVLPAIARVQDVFEILTNGPGTTHTRGEDALGFEVLAQLRTNGLADIHTPSAHFYADKGWKKLDRRMAEVERRFREMGWDRAVASETGCHGHYVPGPRWLQVAVAVDATAERSGAGRSHRLSQSPARPVDLLDRELLVPDHRGHAGVVRHLC